MPAVNSYTPKYTKSWALIIGINTYQHASQLQYARSDAKAVAKVLRAQFGFPAENIKLLIDKNATRQAILESFLRFTKDDIALDDRVLLFFAGHGHTQTGRRGEIGFLVPADGTPDSLATLIRWDELTRNAELVPAKHILFIMDACYGGLAVTRVPSPGSMRFLKDMLQRYSRQVLTAGKADEPVSDGEGPIPNHSIFTGHFLQALEGNAASADGTLTASNVMFYVYEKVGKDHYSRQTPHFGHIEGDGDFVFRAPVLDTLEQKPEIDKDVLVEVPADVGLPLQFESGGDLITTVKEYLSDTRYRIKLNDLATQEIRKVISTTRPDKFPLDTRAVDAEQFLDRLKRYDAITADLGVIVALLSYWGQQEHLSLLEKVIVHIGGEQELSGGIKTWLSLRWYPLMLLMYSGGIAAIAANNYNALDTLFTTKIASKYSGEETREVVLPMVGEITAIHEAFKMLPGHEKHYVPRSEYLFKLLQPNLDDLLFLGKSYEGLFDRFEMFLALVYAHLKKKVALLESGGRLEGLPGNTVVCWGRVLTINLSKKPSSKERTGRPSRPDYSILLLRSFLIRP